MGTPLGRLERNGQGGIRTHETREGPPVFKTGAFNHSATCPGGDGIDADRTKVRMNGRDAGVRGCEFGRSLRYWLA
jgi:hypothetical protein